MVDVFERSEAELAARLVLLALADTTPNDDGSNAHPAVSTIARKARVHPRTAQRALRQLEEQCEIVQTGTTSRGCAIYHLAVVTPLACSTGGGKLSPEVVTRERSEVRAANRHPITAGQDATLPAAQRRPAGEATVAAWLHNVGVHYAHNHDAFTDEISKLGIAGDAAEAYRRRALELTEGGTA